MKFYDVMDLYTEKSEITKSLDKVEEKTGYSKICFTEMKDNDIYFISHFRVKCIEIYNEDEFTYYKNLWKF